MINKSDYFRYIDHTNLKQTATWADIQKLCQEATTYEMASVMIQPCYVKRVREAYPRLVIGTIIGFPNGYNTMATKVYETQDALNDGANEIDLVINLCAVKNQEWDLIHREIRGVRNCSDKPFLLKVIIETCYLTDEEKIKLCEIVTAAGADYIKTSTGFGTSGAKLEDIHLFREHLGQGVQIKAAGGIRTAEDIAAFVEAGCTRIGASTGVQALAE